MNKNGTPANLLPAPEGNTRAVVHGLYSERILAPRAQAIADALMQLPHVQPLDLFAAQEIGSLVARLEAIDRDLDERGHFGRNGARTLLDHKARLSRELRAWSDRFGANPKARFDFAKKLAEPSFAEAVQARIRAMEEAERNGQS